MSHTDEEPLTPHGVIAERVKELRKGRGWSAERLAAEMSAQGVPWSRVVVTKLETGRRPGVTVAELLALARVLEVAPVHLIVPPLSAAELMPPRDRLDRPPYVYAVTPRTVVPTVAVRGWLRGERTFGDIDPRRYFGAVPPDEFAAPPRDEVAERLAAWEAEHQATDVPPELHLDQHSTPTEDGHGEHREET